MAANVMRAENALDVLNKVVPQKTEFSVLKRLHIRENVLTVTDLVTTVSIETGTVFEDCCPVFAPFRRVVKAINRVSPDYRFDRDDDRLYVEWSDEDSHGYYSVSAFSSDEYPQTHRDRGEYVHTFCTRKEIQQVYKMAEKCDRVTLCVGSQRLIQAYGSVEGGEAFKRFHGQEVEYCFSVPNTVFKVLKKAETFLGDEISWGCEIFKKAIRFRKQGVVVMTDRVDAVVPNVDTPVGTEIQVFTAALKALKQFKQVGMVSDGTTVRLFPHGQPGKYLATKQELPTPRFAVVISGKAVGKMLSKSSGRYTVITVGKGFLECDGVVVKSKPLNIETV